MEPEARRTRIAEMLDRRPETSFRVAFNKVQSKAKTFDAAKKYQELKDYATALGVVNDPDFQFDDGRRTFASKRSPQTLADTARYMLGPLRDAAYALNPKSGGTGAVLLEEEFATPETRSYYKELRALVDEEASYQAATYDYNGFDRVFPQPQLDKLAARVDGQSADVALSEMLRDVKSPGLIIGEDHGSPDAWNALTANLPNLKQSRVDTVYVEALRYPTASKISMPTSRTPRQRWTTTRSWRRTSRTTRPGTSPTTTSRLSRCSAR